VEADDEVLPRLVDHDASVALRQLKTHFRSIFVQALNY
jgi:hypothetical protein